MLRDTLRSIFLGARPIHDTTDPDLARKIDASIHNYQTASRELQNTIRELLAENDRLKRDAENRRNAY